MNFHIITIFPESFRDFMSVSIIGKSITNKHCDISLYKLNDFSDKNFKHVDGKAYWMHWQVISPEPLSKALKYIKKKIIAWGEEPWIIPVIYMSPSGVLLNQEKVENYYSHFQKKDIIIICGHYEGIDQRIIDKYVDYEISIGEYVISSWEIAAQVFIDSLVRHIPWVLGNPQSLKEESFSDFFHRQKEHFIYTRPYTFEWMSIPCVLSSWNHKEIEEWKHKNTR